MTLPSTRQSLWRDMLKQRYFRGMLGLSTVLWLLSTGVITARVVPIIYQKTAVPLHYNIHIGVDTIGPWWQIYTVPLIGLIIISVNLFLAKFMWTRDKVLSHLAAAASLILQIILLVAAMFIVFLSLAYA